MLLIEKAVKLLDEFHFDQFRNYVKDLSIRSYYPLALIDVINRDIEVEQPSKLLYKDVYGELPEDEKDMKKFFQLAHYTFKQTEFLARNYPTYLQPNLTHIQQHINSGNLKKATLLADMVIEVANKIEDFDTEFQVLNIIAKKNLLLEAPRQSLQYYERMGHLLDFKQIKNRMNTFMYEQYKEKGKVTKSHTAEENLEFFQPYFNHESLTISLSSRLYYYYALYLLRDSLFYSEGCFKELTSLQDELERNDYLIFPYLSSLRPKLSFLMLAYSLRQLSHEEVLKQADAILEEGQKDKFWNSFVNLPELNSIAVQTSHLVNNYFTSYKEDHLERLPEGVQLKIKELCGRCEEILNNQTLEEEFIVKKINLTTMYCGLLLLGDKTSINKSIDMLEGVLLSYQQIPFHSFIDSIYINLIMGTFCTRDFERLEKNYRRYKKSTKDKIVNPENDLALHGFYYAAKYLETERKQYASKLENVLNDTKDSAILKSTRGILIEVVRYFEIPVSFGIVEK